MSRPYYTRALAALLAFSVLFLMMPDALADGEGGISIFTVEDFLRFAESCSRESYSKNRTFLLMADLDLTGASFSSAPYFAGHFQGNHHTISGVTVSSEGSRLGLFRQIGPDGTVENLMVRGTVNPGGTKEYIGGIAGINEGRILSCSFSGDVKGIANIGGIAGHNASTGVISASSFSGSLVGEHQAGGIAGLNDGSVLQCQSSADVNTVAVTPSDEPSFGLSSISRFDLSSLSEFDLAYLSQDNFVNLSNIAGIAGENNGVVQNCRNYGQVGYRFTGYNVGGIVGKNSGFVDGCANEGSVDGRRDVGGVVGQSIPYAAWDFTNEKLNELRDAVSYMHYLIDNIIDTTDGGGEELLYHLFMMNAYTEQALKALVRSVEGIADSSVTVTTPASSYDFPGSSVRDPLADLFGEDPVPDISRQLSELANGGTLPEDLARQMEELARDTTVTLNLNMDMQGFKNAVGNMFGEATLLAASVGNSITALAQNINDISRQMGYIVNLISSVADDTENLITRKDLSLSEAYQHNEGAVARSSNNAPVRAEANAGGVVGSIGFEVSFDMEDTLNTSNLLTMHAEQTLFAVVRACRSTAQVSSREDSSGGIIGRMDIGAVVECVSSGNISSQNGDYVGGIAGLAKGSVSRCWSRCILEGRRYVGGIAGLGEDLLDCSTWAQISRASEYQGAVAGWAEGEVRSNRYVDSRPDGVDGISRIGQAEPIPASSFLSAGEAPASFETVTVTFYVEDAPFSTVTLPFGGSVDALPSVPNRGSAVWAWDDFDSSAIYGDTEVRGSYVAPRSTISSGEKVPLFLVEGEFYDHQALSVQPCEASSDTLDVIAGYTVSVNDYAGALNVRMRTDAGSDLYLARSGGTLEKLETVSDGQYRVFSVPNGSSIVAVQRQEKNYWRLFLLLAAIAVEIVLLLCLYRKVRKKNRLKAEEPPDPE